MKTRLSANEIVKELNDAGYQRADTVVRESFSEMLVVGITGGALVVLLGDLVPLVFASMSSYKEANLPASEALFLLILIGSLSTFLLYRFWRDTHTAEVIEQQNRDLLEELRNKRNEFEGKSPAERHNVTEIDVP